MMNILNLSGGLLLKIILREIDDMLKRSKRNLSALLAAIMIFGLIFALPPSAAPAASASSEGLVALAFIIDSNVYTVNGVMTVMDVSPVIIEERTMLPIRFVAEPLGAAVGWDDETQRVTVKLMDTMLELWIGQNFALVNGKSTPIDPNNPNVKPITLNDRTMLPVRFVSESLGCGVGWDEASQQVTITMDLNGASGAQAAAPATGAAQPSQPATDTVQPSPTPPPAAESGSPDEQIVGDELPTPQPQPPEASVPVSRDNMIQMTSKGITKIDMGGISVSKMPIDLIALNDEYEDALSDEKTNERTNFRFPPKPTSPPAQPTNLEIVSNRQQKAPKLTWKDNANNETEYIITRIEMTSSKPTIDISLPKDTTTYTDYDAKPGSVYKYLVRCANANGLSKWYGVTDTALKTIRAYKLGEGNVTDFKTSENKGLDFLGCGYNVFGDYASPDTSKGMKAPVLDYKEMVECREVNKRPYTGADIIVENIENSAYEYCVQRTENANFNIGIMGFSGGIGTNFGSMDSKSSNKYLATLTKHTKLYEYNLADPIYFNYSNYLLPSAKQALNDPNVSPATILDTYGTHVMTSVWLGGRLDYNISTVSQTSESFSSFKINAKASFNIGFVSFGGGYDEDTKDRIMSFNSRTNRNVILYGGTARTGQLFTDPQKAADAMDAWRKSLNNDPTFTDFGGQPLKPIWELCENINRRNAIKAEFDKRAQTQKSLFPVPKYVTNIATYNNNQGEPGWSSTGINVRTIQHPMYLFYYLSENPNYALTDLFLRIYSPNGNWPAHEANSTRSSPWKAVHNDNTAGFFRVGANFRSWMPYSAGGLLLYATTDKTKSPIKTIEIVEFANQPVWEYEHQKDPGWEYVMLQNETKPFNLAPFIRINEKWKDPPAFRNDWVYIRFTRE